MIIIKKCKISIEINENNNDKSSQLDEIYDITRKYIELCTLFDSLFLISCTILRDVIS